MATVELSPSFANSVVSAMFLHQSGPSATMVYNEGTFCSTAARLAICKGTVPVTAPSGSRQADVLVFWKIVNTNTSLSDVSNQFFKILGNNTTPTTIFSQYKAAIASGTATWFWYYVGYTPGPFSSYQQPDDPPASVSVINSIWGTVGLPGSGADLIIGNTDIVSGNNYRVNNLNIQLPTTWTY